MPRLDHLKPCPVCPFLRTSAAGYLGEATPVDFVEATLNECEMPCHEEIDYNDPDWEEEQLPDAALCAGALIFMRNQCKLPRDPELAAACKSVAADREAVFLNRAEFLSHHAKGGT